MCFAHISNFLTVYISFSFGCFIIPIWLLILMMKDEYFKHTICFINKSLIIYRSMLDYDEKITCLFFKLLLLFFFVFNCDGCLHCLLFVRCFAKHSTLTHAVLKITMLNRLIQCSHLTDEIIETKCSSKFIHLLIGKVEIWVGWIQNLGSDYLV